MTVKIEKINLFTPFFYLILWSFCSSGKISWLIFWLFILKEIKINLTFEKQNENLQF